MAPVIYFKKLLDNAVIPTRATDGSAGFDLTYIGDPCVLRAGHQNIFETGISMCIDRLSVGIIKPRSGLALKYGIGVQAGVLDSDYRGEVKVVLINHGREDVRFTTGDRIAQLLVVPIFTASKEVFEMPDTERGAGGFGSTGK